MVKADPVNILHFEHRLIQSSLFRSEKHVMEEAAGRGKNCTVNADLMFANDQSGVTKSAAGVEVTQLSHHFSVMFGVSKFEDVFGIFCLSHWRVVHFGMRIDSGNCSRKQS